jgi:cytochrome P450
MGEGILVAEGDLHRAQRRLMNPAFHPGATRELTGIFLDKANEVEKGSLAFQKFLTDEHSCYSFAKSGSPTSE